MTALSTYWCVRKGGGRLEREKLGTTSTHKSIFENQQNNIEIKTDTTI